MRVNLRTRNKDRAGSLVVREKSVPQGPDDSSPVRSAGETGHEPPRPGRDDRSLVAFVQWERKLRYEYSIVPGGTYRFLKRRPTTKVVGYCHRSPSGRRLGAAV